MSRASRRFTAVFFILLSVLFVIFITPKILKLRDLSGRSGRLEADLARIKEQNKRYETELRLLRDDPVYVEKVAREKFNKAKEGEIIYKVVREGENTKSQPR